MRSASSRVSTGRPAPASADRPRPRRWARRTPAGPRCAASPPAARPRGSRRRRPPAPRACPRACAGPAARSALGSGRRGPRRWAARPPPRCSGRSLLVGSGGFRRGRGLRRRVRLGLLGPKATSSVSPTAIAQDQPRILPQHAGEQAEREARDRHQREPEQREQPAAPAARAPSHRMIRRHICSGAEMPRHSSALARTVRTASASPRRALVSAGSSDNTRCRTPSCR